MDDSAVFRLVIRDAIQAIPGCTVVGHAKDGRQALDVIDRCRPHLVTLDIEMPELDGISTLREIRRRWPETQVLMVSRFTSSGASVTTDALLEGAFDFILKPSGGRPAENRQMLRTEIEQRIHALRESQSAETDDRSDAEHETPAAGTDDRGSFRAVVIGTSTGGPDALIQIIPGLSGKLSVPVMIVQHMPQGYTSSLAARLNERSSLQVDEASHGEEPKPGTVLLAPGGRQMGLRRMADGRIVVRLTDDPPEHGCQPAVDYLLRSAAEMYGNGLLTVILTGMGHDGTEGCRQVREQGGRVIAQHQNDCVVYGMPRSVIQANLADRVVQLKYMSAVINREVQR